MKKEITIEKEGLVYSQSKQGNDYFVACHVSLTSAGCVEVEATDDSKARTFDRGIDLESLDEIFLKGSRGKFVLCMRACGFTIARFAFSDETEANEWFTAIQKSHLMSVLVSKFWKLIREPSNRGSVLLELLEGADTEALDHLCNTRRNGKTVLHLVCENIAEFGVDEYWITLLRLVLQHNPKQAAVADESGNLPLHSLLMLLKNPDAIDEAITPLLNSYPDSQYVTARDDMLPIHLACKANCEIAAACILSFSSPIQRMREFLGEPDQLLCVTSSGETPLHLALRSCDADDMTQSQLALFLVSLNPRALLKQDISGASPLHLAAWLNQSCVFDVCATYSLSKAAFTLKDLNGQTPQDIRQGLLSAYDSCSSFGTSGSESVSSMGSESFASMSPVARNTDSKSRQAWAQYSPEEDFGL